VSDAADYYPADWLGVADDYGSPGVKVHSDISADGRAFARGREIHLAATDGPDIARHELAHVLESRSTGLPLTIDNFYESRTSKLKLKPLGRPYEADEFGKADKFFDKYVGKKYSTWGYSEVLSMGMHKIFSPSDHDRVMAADPEYVHFILGLLAAHK
jgi:hypothetical protein